MGFIGELIKRIVLEGDDLDFDWILAGIGVIIASHAGKRNLILDVHTGVWCMSCCTGCDLGWQVVWE